MTDEQKNHVFEFIKVLRSNKYKQCYGYLRNTENKYCVLGVACDISNLSFWRTGNYFAGFLYYSRKINLYGLPEEVMKYYGFAYGDIKYKDNRSLLTDNDIHCLTFSEMADIIERELDNSKTIMFV